MGKVLRHTCNVCTHFLHFQFNLIFVLLGVGTCMDMYINPSPTDDEPSDDMLRRFSRLVARQTKNWARLALYLGLLPADAAQHYQVHHDITNMYMYMYMCMF